MIRIKRDFLKHKTVKTNENPTFRSIHDSIIKENIKRSCKLQHLKRFWREELT